MCGLYWKCWTLLAVFFLKYIRYSDNYSLTCIKRSHIGIKKKWAYQTGDLLEEVQFIWNFLWQDKKWPFNTGDWFKRGDCIGRFDCIFWHLNLLLVPITVHILLLGRTLTILNWTISFYSNLNIRNRMR